MLAFVILVHEAGHFLAARGLGMRVDEFSVGVGPRLLGVRRRPLDGEFVWERISDAANEGDGGDAMEEAGDGIEFSLRALPIGGYVRFPDNYNRTLAFEQEDVARRARNEARLMRLEGSSALEKTLEAVAARSALLNVFTLGLLKRWQAGREENQLREAELTAATESRGMGKAQRSRWKFWPWGAKKEDGSAELDGDRLTILKAAKAPAVAYYDNPDLLQNRPWPERSLVLAGGVIFNILLAFACYFGEVTGGRGLPVPVFDTGAVVSQRPSADSPSFGLLNQGDVIVGVNGRIAAAADSASDVSASQRQISAFISTIRQTPVGESVELTIIHGRDSRDTDVVFVAPRTNDDGLTSIGVMLGPNYLRTDMVRASSVVDGVAKASTAVYQLTAQTASSIVGLLLGLLSGRGLPPGAALSGPIGVVRSGAEIVSRSDFSAVVAFAASISVNLAVVNALPLPALDGGQLAFVLAEAAAGRRIDQRVQEGINAGALFVLLVFSLSTAVGDVTSIFR